MNKLGTMLVGLGFLYPSFVGSSLNESLEVEMVPQITIQKEYVPTSEASYLEGASPTLEQDIKNEKKAMIALDKIRMTIVRLMAQYDEELHCMQLNIYWEARNQDLAGKTAIAAVTLNRVKSKRFPDSVCGVVYQSHQFSWYWDGLIDRPSLDNRFEVEAWKESKRIATLALNNKLKSEVGNATHYHHTDINPWWSAKLVRLVTIEDHIFYNL